MNNQYHIAGFKCYPIIVLFLLLNFQLFPGSPGINSLLSSQKLKNESFLSFEENLGQLITHKEYNQPLILFKAQYKGCNIYITEKGLTYVFNDQQPPAEKVRSLADSAARWSYQRFDIDLKGATILKENCSGEMALPENYNFFYSHCPGGISNVKHYQKITIKNIYPGIDWILYGTGGQGLKYDFIVHKMASPQQIILLYKTLNPLQLKNGSIQLSLKGTTFSEQAPVSFLSSSKQDIPTLFTLLGAQSKVHGDNTYYETEFGFITTAYKTSEDLIIDPLQLWWGTYYGGSLSSVGAAISTDPSGNVFVLGNSNSVNIPLQVYGSLAYFDGNYDIESTTGDLFILKFTNAGLLLWATFLGGAQDDVGRSLKCDSIGNIFITGSTYSMDFPLKNPGGSAYFDSLEVPSHNNIFISKFSNAGQYLWGTYYQGDAPEEPHDLAIDAYNNVYITGVTSSSNFPVYNPGSGAFFQGSPAMVYPNTHNAFLLKFSNSGQRLYASYFGGNAYDEGFCVSCDPFGNVFFAGNSASSNLFTLNPGGGAFFQGANAAQQGNHNGYLVKLNANCQAQWSTYLGGYIGEGFRSMACDKIGNVLLTGVCSSSNFPTVNPGGGAYYTPFTPAGGRMVIIKFNTQSQMTWSTFFGSFSSGFLNLSVGSCNEIYVSHCSSVYATPSQTLNAGNGSYFQGNNASVSNLNDIFLAAFSNSGILRWGTYFGGRGEDSRMITTCDKNGNIFYTGEQGSAGYFTLADFQTYSANCLLNPGNNAFYQPSVLGTPGNNASCVVGKFIGPQIKSAVTTTGCGISNGATISSLNGWGPYDFKWSNGASTASIGNMAPGVYSYTVTDTFFGCTEIHQLYLGLPSFTLNINSADTMVCLGNSLMLQASGANQYSWSPTSGLNSTDGTIVIASPLETTHYTLTGSTNQNCKTDTVIKIVVNPLPILTISGKDSLCKGEDLILKAAGAIHYTWSSVSSTLANTSSVSVQPLSDQIFSVEGADINGCINSSDFKVIVIQKPDLYVSGFLSVCKGNSTTLTATGAAEYRWRNSGNLNMFVGADIIVSPSSSSSLTLIGTNNGICEDSSIVVLSVLDLPEFNVVAPDSACQSMGFQVHATGNGKFNWSGAAIFDCIECRDPIVNIAGPTRLFITLADDNLCVKRDSIFINITNACDFEIAIPNIFTPNDDGVNDVFKLNSKGIKNIKCSIYNRWGTEIISFDRVHGFWDGRTTSGLECAEGVYFYVIYIVDIRKEEHHFKGSVSILR